MKRKKVYQSCPQVAVILDISGESARGIMRGILRFVHENFPWNITYISTNVSNVDSNTLSIWKGNGIITRVTREDTYRQILSLKCPAVLLTEEQFPEIPRRKPPVFVRCDDFAVGKMAAEFFLKKQFRHFAFVPNNVPHAWSDHREMGFFRTLSECGFTVERFSGQTDWKTFSTKEWLAERKEMVRWLAKLPKPVGILAANDFRGRQVLEACQVSGIPVPYQAAVMGVNNDELVCRMSYPSLSSVSVDWEKAGFIAAQSLHLRMSGQAVPFEETYGPMEVVSRNSTEQLHVADPLVVRILETIRLNHAQNLRVSDISRLLKVPVRTAQLRFKNAVGHSILDEIQSVRMEFVCQLLKNTDWTIKEIADRCGFENANHLGIAFKRQFGVTMGVWREK